MDPIGEYTLAPKLVCDAPVEAIAGAIFLRRWSGAGAGVDVASDV